MVGGGVKKMCKSFGKDEQLYLIAMGILIILIKTLVVRGPTIKYGIRHGAVTKTHHNLFH